MTQGIVRGSDSEERYPAPTPRTGFEGAREYPNGSESERDVEKEERWSLTRLKERAGRKYCWAS